MTPNEIAPMQEFIGTKMVRACPMTRADYNKLRGWTVPEDENGDDAGMLVEYVDGGKSNVAGFDGYVSWLPLDIFQRAYRNADFMSFGDVLVALKNGCKVARTGWNGKGMFLFLVPGSTFKVNRAPLMGIYPEGTEINYRSHIDMRTADGSIMPWVASQTDLLATDWVLVP